MIDDDLNIALEHFDERLAQYDFDDPRALSWGSRESQAARFAVLADVGDLRGASILDVGCGTGELYAYLEQRDAEPGQYTGIDINPRMIDGARARHPAGSFEVRNLLTDPYAEGSFDFVVESGIFNLATPNWHNVTCGLLRAMFQTCRTAVAANFLSRLAGNSEPGIHYSDPAEVVRFAGQSLSNRFVLRHDYRTNDFTVFIYR